MGVSKNRGMVKMDGENHGSNPMNKGMIWGVFHLFLEGHPYQHFRKRHEKHKKNTTFTEDCGFWLGSNDGHTQPPGNLRVSKE